MSDDYYVPLSTLIPAVPDFPGLKAVSGWRSLLTKIGVRDYEEVWNDDYQMIRGQAVIAVDASIPLGAFELVFGVGTGDPLAVEFEYSSDRTTLLQSLAQLAIDAGIEGSPKVSVTEAIDILTADGFIDPDNPLLLVEAPPAGFRVVVKGLGARLRLPPGEVIAGQLVKNAEQEIVGVTPVEPEAPVELALPSFTFSIDSEDGIRLSLDNDQLIDLPPFIHKGTNTGWEADQVKIDVSRTDGYGEVTHRPELDESWEGITINAARVFNLDALLEFLPQKIEVAGFRWGSDGLSGTFEVSWEDPIPGQETSAFRLEGLALEWDRSHLVRGSADVLLRAGSFHNDLASIGPDGDLELAVTLRHNPDLGWPENVGWEFAVRTPSPDDRGLITLEREAIELMQVGLMPALLIATGLTGSTTTGIAGALLVAAAALQTSGELYVDRLRLDSLALRSYTQQVDGHPIRFYEAVTDWEIRIGADMNVAALGGILPRLKTEKPIGVAIRGLVIRVAPSVPQGVNVPAVSLALDDKSGISFDVSEQSILDVGYLLRVTKIGVGQWQDGFWINVGFDAMDSSGGGVSVGESYLRLYFDQDGNLVNVDFLKDPIYTMVVPNVFYVRGTGKKSPDGELERIEARGFFIGKGTAVTAADHMRRENYLLDVDVGILYADLEGVRTLVVTAGAEYSSGIPVYGNTAIYGASLQYAQNAQPALDGHGYDWWYMTKAPQHQVVASKWEPAAGGWGFGAGIVLGSQSGSGKHWNMKIGGLLLLPGPVFLVYGTGNAMSEPPKVADSSSGALSVLLQWDLANDDVLAAVDFDYKKPKNDGRLLTVRVPAELRISPDRFYFYAGRDKPLSKHMRLRYLDIFDVSGYLMLDSGTIPDIAGSGLDVPGFAIALGLRGDWTTGYRGSKVKCYFHLLASLDAALSFDSPRTCYGAVLLQGGLVVKVYGFGFEFNVEVDATYIAANERRQVDGTFRLTINLPWPVPDVRVDVPITCGDDSVALENPGTIVQALTLLPRGRNEPVEIVPGQTLSDVPIDPVLTLAFGYPIQNDTTALGPFLMSEKKTTWFVAAGDAASGEIGYRFTLTGLRLKKREANGTFSDVTGSIPATWVERPADVKAKGGQKLRNALDLFDYGGSAAVRMMGTAATYQDGVLQTWDPCAGYPDPGMAIYLFGGEALGAVEPGRDVELAGRPDLGVDVVPESPGAPLLRAAYGLYATAPALVDEPGILDLPGAVDHVIELPLLCGTPEAFDALGDWSVGDERYAPGIELRCDPALAVQVDVLRLPNATLRVRFYAGSTLVAEDQTGTVLDSIPQDDERGILVWLKVRYETEALGLGIDRVVIDGWRQDVDDYPDRPAYLYEVGVRYLADAIALDDATATQQAWSQLWTELLSQDAATSDALLLMPDSVYRLEVDVDWETIGPQAPKTGTETSAFTLRTKADAPTALRGREASVGNNEDDWDVDVVPAHGTVGAYVSRPVGTIFRDPRTEAVFASFGHRLVLRLVDGEGNDLFERLAILAERAPELPEYQQSVLEWLANSPCVPPGAENLFALGYAEFSSVLSRDSWYDAYVVSVDDPNGDLDLSNLPPGFDWDAQPVLYSARFKTSRFDSLTEHAASYQVLDEVAAGSPDLAALAAALGGATPGRVVVGDEALESAVAALGLVPRAEPRPAAPTQDPGAAAAPPPEVVRIWRENAGSWDVIALLMDGPEPLLRDGASLQAGVGLFEVRGASGARSLVLFPSFGAFGPLAGDLDLTVAETYYDLAGHPVADTATIAVALPDQPGFFGPEED